ncbi:MAG TPA: hypothetical protein VLY24_17860 [Bryobacteraceae bacterium]|nr:hypothetical protein [Bryobacteraceae bacterium]
MLGETEIKKVCTEFGQVAGQGPAFPPGFQCLSDAIPEGFQGLKVIVDRYFRDRHVGLAADDKDHKIVFPGVENHQIQALAGHSSKCKRGFPSIVPLAWQ